MKMKMKVGGGQLRAVPDDDRCKQLVTNSSPRNLVHKLHKWPERRIIIMQGPIQERASVKVP